MDAQRDRERLLRRYIELKRQAEDIEAQLEAMKGEVFVAVTDLLEQTGGKSYLFEDYEFSAQYRRTYDYPPDIKKMEDELKALKKEAEASGRAKIKSETGYVVLKKSPAERA
ncbi:MAG: hypothetical protein NZM06_09260 [Chloroherpetonaceae bacterium]|nr:hypothetical protein [Chloroherpetonaceae bacterium]MDW8437316.1 hypothetical protein [Chloroherpetonaceae bacterium]